LSLFPPRVKRANVNPHAILSSIAVLELVNRLTKLRSPFSVASFANVRPEPRDRKRAIWENQSMHRGESVTLALVSFGMPNRGAGLGEPVRAETRLEAADLVLDGKANPFDFVGIREISRSSQAAKLAAPD
jgi:hypothetical protein